MTQVIQSTVELIQFRESFSFSGSLSKIGFVPTMGALHEGHASLLKKAREENQLIILSVFVNPTQFNNPNDLTGYPKTFEHDLSMARKEKVDVLFFPKYEDIYADNYRFKLTENEFSKKLCGAHRPGHFDGVLTVVLKLLMLTKANKAYFGEKDYQQLKLVQDMAKALFVETKIIGCPTFREHSGLAMSSRNLRLSPQALEKASLIYKTIKNNSANEAFEKLKSAGFDVDYVEEHFGRRFVAASLEGIRLIDNVEI